MDSATFEAIRRHMLLDCCKWDPQVGDVGTLANFPLMITAKTWRELSALAEALANETSRAGDELLSRPALHRHLGLPRALRRLLRACGRGRRTPSAAHVIRFDFHWTRDGWRISEANSDVPGGYTEASSFARAMAACYSGTQIAGDPAAELVGAIRDHVPPGGSVALLAAAGYMEDQQVTAYLAQRLGAQGITAHCCEPQRLDWEDGHACLNERLRCHVDAIVRFFQAEWLAGLPGRCGWRYLIADGKTPVTNPAAALFAESKRFPLVWDQLWEPMSTWRRLLPETRDPRDAPWRSDDGWLLKSTFCNTGDAVMTRAFTPPALWRKAAREATWRPSGWVAQRRFEPARIDTPIGAAFPCVGVYTVNGRAAGIYGRLTTGNFIDYTAVDVAVLVEDGLGQSQ